MTLRQTPLSAGFAAALMTITMTATAQDTGVCEPFTMISDGTARTVTYVDAGADGPGPGDQRIGRRELADMDGNPIGYIRWIGTVLDQPNDDGTPGETYAQFVVVLADGDIMYRNLDTTNRPAQDTGDVTWDAAPSGVISGGNGAYAGARGTVGHSRDGLAVTFEVDIDCS